MNVGRTVVSTILMCLGLFMLTSYDDVYVWLPTFNTTFGIGDFVLGIGLIFCSLFINWEVF